MYCSHYETRFGPGSVYATDDGVSRVVIPDMSTAERTGQVDIEEDNASELTIGVAQMLERYFQGEQVNFTGIPVDLGGLTAFRRSVLAAARNLLYGDVCSYGRLADECGSPHAARAIGGALAANPVPVVIPCHRIVAANGCLTGFSALGGVSTKMTLLQMEGVAFKGARVVINQMVINRRRNCQK